MGFLWVLGLRVQDLGFRFQDMELGFTVSGLTVCKDVNLQGFKCQIYSSEAKLLRDIMISCSKLADSPMISQESASSLADILEANGMGKDKEEEVHGGRGEDKKGGKDVASWSNRVPLRVPREYVLPLEISAKS